MSVSKRLSATFGAALLVSFSVSAFSVAAQDSPFCAKTPGGKFQPSFAVEPSLVVHDEALDVTRGQLGLGGDAGEKAFSFKQTIRSILASAGAGTGASEQAAFLQTMLDGLAPGGSYLNRQGGVLVPVGDRSEADALDPATMLDERPDSTQTMEPLALFNRFDLAPADWRNCGEHRIIYGKRSSGTFDRFLLIFEAGVPNPTPGKPEGCRRVAEFWAELSTITDKTERARRLFAFYYEGKTGRPDGDLVDPSNPDEPAPVVSFRNYGGDGGRGQVRSNMFVAQPWELREWLVQKTFAAPGKGPALAFVPETVKDNPLPQLYLDDLSSEPSGVETSRSQRLADANMASALATLQGQYLQALTSSIATNLLPEQSLQFQDAVGGLDMFDLGSSAVGRDQILLTSIGLGADNKFDDFRSISQGTTDFPGAPEDKAFKVRQMLGLFDDLPVPGMSGQSGQIMLNRAAAGTCGGCHMSAAGAGMTADGTLTWPQPARGGFVQVREDRTLSPALTGVFLPVRRYNMARYLCRQAPQVAAMSVAGAPTASVPARSDLPVDRLIEQPRYLDAVVRQFVAAEAPGAATMAPMAETDEAGSADASLSSAQRRALRQRVEDAVQLARESEQLQPGAFVQTRRPH